MLPAAALTVSLLAPTAHAEGAASAQRAAAPAKSSCDESGWDWHYAQIAPGDTRWNPRTATTKTQMWQWHVWREDTWVRAVTRKKGTYVYLYDQKSGQKCKSPNTPIPTGRRPASPLGTSTTATPPSTPASLNRGEMSTAGGGTGKTREATGSGTGTGKKSSTTTPTPVPP